MPAREREIINPLTYSMNVLTDAELQRLLDPDEVISALRSAFARGFADLKMPPPHLEVEDGTVLII